MPKVTKRKTLKNIKMPQTVWKGPGEDGVTQSLLGRFLSCRERFRLLTMEGLRPADSFNVRLEYGNLWHTCEEAHAKQPGNQGYWQDKLKQYAIGLSLRYPTSREQVQHWYRVCLIQFPLYVTWWEQHPDMLARQPLLEEVAFAVPYDLPSGRRVLLRGKFDSVDLIGEGPEAKVWLQENKTKGDIDAEHLQRQLTFDFQTMFYLVALREYDLAALENPTLDAAVGALGATKVFNSTGVRYNVIRRPLAGGKHSIRQHKPSKGKPEGETADEFYTRLQGLMQDESLNPDGSHHYFMRWNVEVSRANIETFEKQCLIPILEQLWDWWEWVTKNPDPFVQPDTFDGPRHPQNHLHFRFPFGIYNPTLEGNTSDLDEYLISGSLVGLERTTNLFPELTSVVST